MQLQTTSRESKFPKEYSDVIFIQIDQHLKKLLQKYKGVPTLWITVYIYKSDNENPSNLLLISIVQPPPAYVGGSLQAISKSVQGNKLIGWLQIAYTIYVDPICAYIDTMILLQVVGDTHDTLAIFHQLTLWCTDTQH